MKVQNAEIIIDGIEQSRYRVLVGSDAAFMDFTSSSGKTTLALALQKQFDTPFIRFSFDLFLDHKAFPMEQIRNGTFSWDVMRPPFSEGFISACLLSQQLVITLFLTISSKPKRGYIISFLQFQGWTCSLWVYIVPCPSWNDGKCGVEIAAREKRVRIFKRFTASLHMIWNSILKTYWKRM